MFPTIRHLNDLKPFVEANPQFRIQEVPSGHTVVCYMLQDEDTFTGENEEYARECRGITFDKTGKIASRTLHKFQNVGEAEATMPHNIPWNDIVRVMDKRDGSMITMVRHNDTIICKTKKTFTSAEAQAANWHLACQQEMIEWLKRILWAGFTPTFEWTSPRFPIVLTYKEDALTLLQIRDNVSGRYLIPETDGLWELLTANCPFPQVENLIGRVTDVNTGKPSWDVFNHLQLTMEGVEGWIIQAKNGEMWKVKTKWYCDLHHSVTFTRWRDVARTVLEDKSDDLKAAFAMTGRDIEPILEVERKIGNKIDNVRLLIEEYVGNGRVLNRTAKDMAFAHKGHEHFGLIMRMFRDQQIDWFDWYLKNHINDWGLEVIPTVVQNEDNESVEIT